MPNHSSSNNSQHTFVFCHPYLEELVRRQKISSEDAASISFDQFNESALSSANVFRLVCAGLMSASDALSLGLEDFNATALSHPHIYRLVEISRMDLQFALSMDIAEVTDPMTYLENLPVKSERQCRKLALYERFPDIEPIYIEMILLHEFNPGRMPSEDRELALLLDPMTRGYASRITFLEFFASRTPTAERELDLLYDFYARDYAPQIVRLEFKLHKTVDDELDLEMLYLKVCCKIPCESRSASVIRQRLEADGVIQLDAVPRGCGDTMRLGAASLPASLASLGIFATSNRAQIASMKASIDRIVKAELIMCYLEMNQTPKRAIETEHMQAYIKDKVAELRLGILKFFTSGKTPDYSEENLRILVSAIREKIVNREFTLNCREKIMDLQGMIAAAPEVHDKSQRQMVM